MKIKLAGKVDGASLAEALEGVARGIPEGFGCFADASVEVSVYDINGILMPDESLPDQVRVSVQRRLGKAPLMSALGSAMVEAMLRLISRGMNKGDMWKQLGALTPADREYLNKLMSRWSNVDFVRLLKRELAPFSDTLYDDALAKAAADLDDAQKKLRAGEKLAAENARLVKLNGELERKYSDLAKVQEAKLSEIAELKRQLASTDLKAAHKDEIQILSSSLTKSERARKRDAELVQQQAAELINLHRELQSIKLGNAGLKASGKPLDLAGLSTAISNLQQKFKSLEASARSETAQKAAAQKLVRDLERKLLFARHSARSAREEGIRYALQTLLRIADDSRSATEHRAVGSLTRIIGQWASESLIEPPEEACVNQEVLNRLTYKIDCGWDADAGDELDLSMLKAPSVSASQWASITSSAAGLSTG
ncbi:hypothetical protein [Geopseudomonas aromaticivorans]